LVNDFFSFTLLVSQRRFVLRGWGGELLRRDNVDKRKRKKETYPPAVTSLQGFVHRCVTPVSLNLWGSAGVGSSHLFAAQREIASLMVSLPG
jgi:hypothetical protein